MNSLLARRYFLLGMQPKNVWRVGGSHTSERLRDPESFMIFKATESCRADFDRAEPGCFTWGEILADLEDDGLSLVPDDRHSRRASDRAAHMLRRQVCACGIHWQPSRR